MPMTVGEKVWCRATQSYGRVIKVRPDARGVEIIDVRLLLGDCVMICRDFELVPFLPVYAAADYEREVRNMIHAGAEYERIGEYDRAAYEYWQAACFPTNIQVVEGYPPMTRPLDWPTALPVTEA